MNQNDSKRLHALACGFNGACWGVEYNDRFLLLDFGGQFDAGGKVLAPVLPESFYGKTDAILLTHSHNDHDGGLQTKGFRELALASGGKIPIFASVPTRDMAMLALQRGKNLNFADFGPNSDLLKPGWAYTAAGMLDNEYYRRGLDDSEKQPYIFYDDGVHEQRLSIGSFFVGCHPVMHQTSLGAMSIRVGIDNQVLIYEGDFNFPDNDLGRQFLRNYVGWIAKSNATHVICDSTRANLDETEPSDLQIARNLAKVVQETVGLCGVTAFASNFLQFQMAVDAALKAGRKFLVLAGRSVQENLQMAINRGYLNLKGLKLVDASFLENGNEVEGIQVLPQNTIVFFAGTQGEDQSALVRFALGTLWNINHYDQATIVILASVIPGNEAQVLFVVNELLHRKVRVVANDPYLNTFRDVTVASIYRSGHASGNKLAEQVKLIMKEMKGHLPVLILAHGDLDRQKAFFERCVSLGYSREKLIIPANGQIIDLTTNLVEMAVQTGSTKRRMTFSRAEPESQSAISSEYMGTGRWDLEIPISFDPDGWIVLTGSPVAQINFDGSSKRRPDRDFETAIVQSTLAILLSHLSNGQKGRTTAPFILNVKDPALLFQELRSILVDSARHDARGVHWPRINLRFVTTIFHGTN